MRDEYRACRAGSINRATPNTGYDQARMQAIAVERDLLSDWRRRGLIQDDTYHLLEEELDRAELHAAKLENFSLSG